MSEKTGIRKLLLNRENLYAFFACFFKAEITPEFFEQLRYIEFPLDREENAITEFNDALNRLHEYFEYDCGETLDDLAADYAKTFLGAGSAQASGAYPYESVYTSPKRIMMQDAWVQMCELFESKGLEGTQEAGGLSEDHISMELEYMAWLCDETSQCTEILSGLEEQREFLNKHLLNWIPEFCLDIKVNADTEFYRMVGQLTTGFLQLDSYILDSMIAERKAQKVSASGYRVGNEKMEAVLQDLLKKYHVYGPKCFKNQGPKADEDCIRYAPITSMTELVLDRQSDFSPKEAFYPISQTAFNFHDNTCSQAELEDKKGIIILAHPCDINGIKRLDNIFLANGGVADIYYKRMRDKVKFFMLECEQSFENCTCVSMGSNKAENYALAMKIRKEDVLVQVKDPEIEEYFEGIVEHVYEPTFIMENEKKVRIPDITSPQILKKASDAEFWKEYNEKCISCGGCNAVCISCSCFDMVDFFNQQNTLEGQRKRVWSSCMMPDYSKTAGGHIQRPDPDKMMRFKTMHKVYDYHKRFGGNEHMCVGCGRCTMRCPQDISFIDTVNRLSEEVDHIKEELSEA